MPKLPLDLVATLIGYNMCDRLLYNLHMNVLPTHIRVLNSIPHFQYPYDKQS